jgi:hypothetical protein
MEALLAGARSTLPLSHWRLFEREPIHIANMLRGTQVAPAIASQLGLESRDFRRYGCVGRVGTDVLLFRVRRRSDVRT